MEVKSIIIYEPSQGLCLLPAHYPFMSEVLVSLLFTCSGTHLRHITSERAGSEHKPVRRVVGYPWQHLQYSSIISYKMADINVH